MENLEVNGYYALAAPLCALLLISDDWIRWRRGEERLGFANTVGNISTATGLVVVGVFLGPVLITLYEFAQARVSLVSWAPDSWVPWVLALVVGDFCYYWHHRAGHTFAVLWAIHGVHHQSDRFDAGIALRSPWFADLYSAPFYALAPVLGIPAKPFFVGITLVTLYSFTIHSLSFDRRSWFFLVTPGTHIAHHSTLPKYADHNYSAMFNIWDRLFGTYVEVDPRDDLALGISEGYETHDGALANWVLVSRLMDLVRQTPRLADKVQALFGRPGWVPPGAVAKGPGRVRDEAAIPVPVRHHVLIQFAAVIGLSIHVVWFKDIHPSWLLIAGSLAILSGLGTIGGLLDGRRGAVRHELWRLAGLVPLALLFAASGRLAIAAWVVAGSLAGVLTMPRLLSSRLHGIQG